MSDMTKPLVIGGRNVWYGLDLQPISTVEADALLGNIAATRVALTEHGERGEADVWAVSTVFLVMDARLSEDGPPLLWETAWFGGDGRIRDAWRYTSREAAEDGHERVVTALLAGEEP